MFRILRALGEAAIVAVSLVGFPAAIAVLVAGFSN